MRTAQRGVALITVLLVFALVAVVAAEMLRRGHLSLRGVAGLVESRQAYYHALAGEAYARQVLARQALTGEGVDRLTDLWATTAEQPPFDIDGGRLRVEIRDLQGRFDLNSVVDEAGVADPAALARLRGLLAALQLDARYAAEWQDWIDADQRRSPEGAEDGDYPGLRTAGRREADISALRQLRSMTPEDYQRLAPFVAVLPAPVPVNVNTAPAPVLRALAPGIIGEATAARMLARQQSGGYADVDAFLRDAGVDGAALPTLAVQSRFFEVRVTVEYLDRWLHLRTVLRRDHNAGRVAFAVLSRERGPLIDDGEP